MRKSNYDKYPSTSVNGSLWEGWDAILNQIKMDLPLKDGRHVLVVECYQGVHHKELLEQLALLPVDERVDTRDLFRAEAEIEEMTRPFLTDDRLFGRRSSFSYADFLDNSKMEAFRSRLKQLQGVVVLVYGHGAAWVADQPDTLVYADMARWEIQLRSRRHEVEGLGVRNSEESPSLHYKRGYFVDWIVCDNFKKQLIPRVDYWLDTQIPYLPKMVDASTWREGLTKTVQGPFRVVPFFDPAPWGGQWMKEVCDLDKEQANFGWCFDCVPEENSLSLLVNGVRFEMPANNLVFYKTQELLGGPVEARFGADFPIRFDFLDTMEGGNLSLQVHPTTQYIRDTFGQYYTQDESYYLLDATEEASVYLGLKEGVDPAEMVEALRAAQQAGGDLDVDRFVNKWPARKHDHFLIPGGTVHCSGAGAMVLEISATPSLFTFKLWDWGRLGLDGLPRPINIEHGKNVIKWERTTGFARRELVNRVEPIASGEGWTEERTGLHENEFIETRRHWFTGKVLHHTGGGVNVLNVIEGDELLVESPQQAFEPFVVHYADLYSACIGRELYDPPHRFIRG